MRHARLLLLLLPSAAGQLILGLTLTLSGSPEEVAQSQRVQKSLELLVSTANDNAFGANAFKDHRGNRLVFGLRVYDDQGLREKVREHYTAMIRDRLVDVLLGPATQLLSEEAAQVAWEERRTIMLYAYYTLAYDPYPIRANLPGIFSVSVPAEEHMQQGLRIFRSMGAQSLAVLIGTQRHYQVMCNAAVQSALQMGFLQSQLIVERPADDYELLRAMQRKFTQGPDAIMLCGSEEETIACLMASMRLNISAQGMLLLHADTRYVHQAAGVAVTQVVAPNSWHPSMSLPCRAFGTSDHYVRLHELRYGDLPSALAAAATGGAITVMQTLQNCAFEGPDVQKNTLLTQALRLAGVDTVYGRVEFSGNGVVQRSAVTLQVEASDDGVTSQLLDEANTSSMVWPHPSWESKFLRTQECPAGFVTNPDTFNGSLAECLPCPAGWTNSPTGEWCQECTVGFFAQLPGSQCIHCPVGANCADSGTSVPAPVAGYYRLDGHPQQQLFFVACMPDLCVGDNKCFGTNSGILCHSCLPGSTNVGFVRNYLKCGSCLPRGLLAVILIIYVGAVFFLVAVTAQATAHGMIWKRILNYWQICSAATRIGGLYYSSNFLQTVSDVVLYPFHTILGPDCLFNLDSMSKETFVFAVGLALLPLISVLTTIFFLIATGVQLGRQQSSRKKRGGSDLVQIKKYFGQTLKGGTRWNVAALYVLYCPTLIIFMSCFSFESLDVLRMRYWLDVPAERVVNFSIISACVSALQGVAIPLVLWLVLRNLKKRHLLKDKTWQYVFGMLYNDFEPEFWFYELSLFVKRFLFMAGSAIPDLVLRVFVFGVLGFVHLQSIVLLRPFSTMEGNVLHRLETRFVLSLFLILSAQLLIYQFPGPVVEIASEIVVILAHCFFSLLALRSIFSALVFQRLTLKAMAMPQALSRVERWICPSESGVYWDAHRQRLCFATLNKSQRQKLLNVLISVMRFYVAKGRDFHSSYLCVSAEQAMQQCISMRREALIVDHPRILVQQRRPGVMGGLLYWFPMLPGNQGAAEGARRSTRRPSRLAPLQVPRFLSFGSRYPAVVSCQSTSCPR
ncbi:unnamed protein product [Effrenium voratum]|nr:unnamed protein product [Effrenium voratum]